VEVRVEGAAGAMLIRRGDETAAVFAEHPVLAASCDASLVLEIAERRLPRRCVRLVDGAAGVLAAEGMEEADALRRREDEVEARDRRQLLLLRSPRARVRVDPFDRDRPRLVVPTQLFPAHGVGAAYQQAELALAHNALEPKGRRPTTDPHPRRLTPARVIVIHPRRHRTLVVRLLPRRQLRHTQH
jgi:hypothetical protein